VLPPSCEKTRQTKSLHFTSLHSTSLTRRQPHSLGGECRHVTVHQQHQGMRGRQVAAWPSSLVLSKLVRRDDSPSAALALLKNPCRFSQQLSKLGPVWSCGWHQSHWLPTVSLHKLHVQTKNESAGIAWGRQYLAIATFHPSHHTGYAHLHVICPTSPMCSV
jgi:hypothetical protein